MPSVRRAYLYSFEYRGGRPMNQCCMCKTTTNCHMYGNPWGDIHLVCGDCLPKLKKHFGEGSE
jgi:hypothetical protein